MQQKEGISPYNLNGYITMVTHMGYSSNFTVYFEAPSVSLQTGDLEAFEYEKEQLYLCIGTYLYWF